MMHVAPRPALVAPERADDRMRGGRKMRLRVRMGWILAAPDVTAGQADAKRHPFFAQREAFLAAFRGRRRIADRREVFAALVSVVGDHRRNAGIREGPKQ